MGLGTQAPRAGQRRRAARGPQIAVVSWLDEVGGTIRRAGRLICPLASHKTGARRFLTEQRSTAAEKNAIPKLLRAQSLAAN